MVDIKAIITKVTNSLFKPMENNTGEGYVEKAQVIRLIDVAFFGPAMIFIGLKYKHFRPWEKAFLILGGGATLWYNLKNYLINQKRLKEKEII